MLQAQLAAGELLDLQLYTPMTGTGTDTNRTLLVSIQYVARGGQMPLPTEARLRQLFSDRATYELEKVAEAKLLDAQWDVHPRRLP